MRAPPGRGTWEVPGERPAERLDRALAEYLDVPRNQIQRWIAGGHVRVDGRAVARASEPLRPGARVEWNPPQAEDDRIVPEEGELTLLYEDDDLLVLDKPAELVVHPGAGRRSGTLAHRLLARFPELGGVGGPGRPGIVHRLDRGTSGVLAVARNAASYTALAKAFAAREVDKRYLAIVWGTPSPESGTIDAPIGRHPTDRTRMAIRTRGRQARTGWRVVANAGPVSLVELDLHTGRTHQIRVHLKHLGHPLVGDPVYGEARERGLRGRIARLLGAFPRPALHARSLALPHPRSGEPLHVEAPPPADLEELWNAIAGLPIPAARQD